MRRKKGKHYSVDIGLSMNMTNGHRLREAMLI